MQFFCNGHQITQMSKLHRSSSAERIESKGVKISNVMALSFIFLVPRPFYY